MKIRFVWVGKTKNEHWRALAADYQKRLGHLTRFEIVELKDETMESEGVRILDKVAGCDLVVAMDVKGRAVSSPDLARLLETWQNRGVNEVAFIIGGADGLAPAVLEKSNERLSLSAMTFTHETARVLLLEQIYRAFTIIKGLPYHK